MARDARSEELPFDELEGASELFDEPFDCLKWLREVRDQIYEETKHMTTWERAACRRAGRPKEGLLARMWERMDSPEDMAWVKAKCLPPDRDNS